MVGARRPGDPARVGMTTDATGGATVAGGADPSSHPPLLIVGMPRSGTTWTQRILECEAALYSLMEPDSEGRRASAIWAKHKAGRFPVLAPGDEDDAYHQLWAWILHGAPESLRLKLAAKVLHVVRPPERKRFLQGRASPIMSAAGALASHPGDRRNPVLDRNRLLVKTVHAPLAIEWIASEFEVSVLVLLRHPGSILASWISLDLNDQYVPLHESPSVQRLVASWDVPLPGPDHLERMIWQIGVLVTALEKSAASHPEWAMRTHEQMCVDPEAEFRRLYDELGLEWNEKATASLASNDRPGKGFRVQRVAADLPDDWKRRLTAEQAAEMKRVLSWFPLTTWSKDDLDLASQG
jgi:hypothetical protein